MDAVGGMSYDKCPKCENPTQGMYVYYDGKVSDKLSVCINSPAHSLEGGLLTAAEAALWERDQWNSAWQRGLKLPG